MCGCLNFVCVYLSVDSFCCVPGLCFPVGRELVVVVSSYGMV